MEIKEKLFNIQQELKVQKSRDAGRYKYRTCDDILSAVKPMLETNKCIITLTDQLENIGDRYYIKAIATLQDVDSTDMFSTTAYAREEEKKNGMDGSQITGASSSYARKYALNGLLAIDNSKDSDVTNRPSKKETISDALYDELAGLCKKANRTEKYIADSMKLKSLHELPKESYAKVKIALLKIIKEEAENVPK